MTDLSPVEGGVAAVLMARLGAGERSNALDIAIEVATFQPDDEFESCRPNAAGTKVIYSMTNGSQFTCWARDWSMDHERENALLALHALADRGRATSPSGGV